MSVNWDERYSGEEYLYGEQPNDFLHSLRDRFHAGMRALLPADGDGRNGVWLAECGLQVDTVDGSAVAVAKAQRLAARRGVEINAQHADLVEWEWPQDSYDLVAAIFVHLPSSIRQQLHRKMLSALRPGGLLVMEAFHPEQLRYRSGGPKDVDMLFTEGLLREDFAEADVEALHTKLIELDESDKHRGTACVVRLLARRKR